MASWNKFSNIKVENKILRKAAKSTDTKTNLDPMNVCILYLKRANISIYRIVAIEFS